MTFKTEQEQFWAGDFGDDYISRNQSAELLASNLNFFATALKLVQRPASIIEFGANVGMNLRALKLLFPEITPAAVEINERAAKQLAAVVPAENIFNGSIFDYPATEQFDVALIKGVLIHIKPEMLPVVYEKLYESAKKYILIGEYYNRAPVAINYRGHIDRLFKRDFCGDFLDKYAGQTRLLDYGFAYHRDPSFPQDDITWFLVEKME